MMIPDAAAQGLMLQEAMRELEAAIHDARVAFDCIGLGEIDRAHTSAVTARIEIEAALTAVQAVMAQTAAAPAGQPAPGYPAPGYPAPDYPAQGSTPTGTELNY